MRNIRFALILAALLACFGTTVRAAGEKPLQVLFVGNLPAVFTALAARNGHEVHADMLVKGGATLTDWLDSGAVQHALKASHYDYVVLQERGNDFACGFGPQACRDSRHALHTLTGAVRDAGARPVLMGTYQVSPAASETLVAAESKAATADDTPYIDVSRPLNAGREQVPYDDWFAKAGHPGHALVLLEAVLLYQQLYGTQPQAQAVAVRAPMFVPGSKFAPPTPVSEPLLPDVALSGGYDYSRNDVAQAIKLASGH
jgi:hypothetical protein